MEPRARSSSRRSDDLLECISAWYSLGPWPPAAHSKPCKSRCCKTVRTSALPTPFLTRKARAARGSPRGDLVPIQKSLAPVVFCVHLVQHAGLVAACRTLCTVRAYLRIAYATKSTGTHCNCIVGYSNGFWLHEHSTSAHTCSFHYLAEAKHQSSAHAIVSCTLLYVAMSAVGIRTLAENRVQPLNQGPESLD